MYAPSPSEKSEQEEEDRREPAAGGNLRPKRRPEAKDRNNMTMSAKRKCRKRVLEKNIVARAKTGVLVYPQSDPNPGLETRLTPMHRQPLQSRMHLEPRLQVDSDEGATSPTNSRTLERQEAPPRNLAPEERRGGAAKQVANDERETQSACISEARRSWAWFVSSDRGLAGDSASDQARTRPRSCMTSPPCRDHQPGPQGNAESLSAGNPQDVGSTNDTPSNGELAGKRTTCCNATQVRRLSRTTTSSSEDHAGPSPATSEGLGHGPIPLQRGPQLSHLRHRLGGESEKGWSLQGEARKGGWESAPPTRSRNADPC